MFITENILCTYPFHIPKKFFPLVSVKATFFRVI